MQKFNTDIVDLGLAKLNVKWEKTLNWESHQQIYFWS
jgi:hypothetical protein